MSAFRVAALSLLVAAAAAMPGRVRAAPPAGPGPGPGRLFRLPLLERPPALLTPAVPSDEPERLEYAPAVFDEAARRLASTNGPALAATAAALVGTRVGRDCFNFVVDVFLRHGADLRTDGGSPGDNGVRILWRFADRRGGLYQENTPAPGDLVFFDDTYDRNRDGRRNDPLTHVGIVEKVEGDRIWFIHRVARGVVRSVMSLAEPDVRARDGITFNDYVRYGRRAMAERLAGTLFAGFARLAAESEDEPTDRRSDASGSLPTGGR